MDNSKFNHDGPRGQANGQSDSIDAKMSEDENRNANPPAEKRRSRPQAKGAAETSRTNDEGVFTKKTEKVKSQGLVYESRDEVVMRHAVRLGIVGKLVDAPTEPALRQVVIGDGEVVHLFMNVTGRADGDNGLAMLTVENLPGAAEMLRRMAMVNSSATLLVGGLNK